MTEVPTPRQDLRQTVSKVPDRENKGGMSPSRRDSSSINNDGPRPILFLEGLFTGLSTQPGKAADHQIDLYPSDAANDALCHHGGAEVPCLQDEYDGSRSQSAPPVARGGDEFPHLNLLADHGYGATLTQ